MKSLSIGQLLQQLSEIDTLAPAQYRVAIKAAGDTLNTDRRATFLGRVLGDIEAEDGRALIRGRAIDCICDYRTQGPAEFRGEVLIVLEGMEGKE